MRNRRSRRRVWAVAYLASTCTGLFGTAQAADGDEIQEVVVTAERRSEDIEKTPIAIDAVSATDLADRNITNGTQLPDLVPGLKMSTERGAVMLFIRGIGSIGGNPYTNPDVLFNLDGQALDLPIGVNGAFYDLARIEVLEGPQGTLYGRNAAAGVVNIVTNDPTQKNEASAELQAGDYGLFQSTAMLNVPVSSDFAIRAAFLSVRHSGYISGNDADDADDIAGRLKALWTPNDQVRLLLGMDYYHEGGVGAQRVPMNNNDTFYAGAWAVPEFYPLGGGETDLIPHDSYTNNRNIGVWANLAVDMGFGTLTVLPAYRAMIQDNYTHDLGFGFLQQINDRNATLELRLASNDKPDSRVRWVGGVYGMNETMPNYVDVQQSFPLVGSGVPEGTQTTSAPDQTTSSYAGFFQTTVSILPALRLTGGVRYTHDLKVLHAFTVNDNPNGIPGGVGSFHSDFDVTGSKVTWRVGLDYDLTDNTLLYANTSTGYKVGGFGAFPDATPTAPASPYATYGPESVRAYDAGLKTELLNRRLVLNAEAFYYIYVNQQINTIFLFSQAACCGGSGAAITPSSVNAGHGTDPGLDVSASYLITPSDKIDVNLEYLDSKYQTFVYPFLFSLSSNSGQPFNYAPRFSGNFGYSHSWQLANGADVRAAFNTHLTTNYWVTYNYQNECTPACNDGLQAGYSRSDFNLGYTAPNELWHVTAWIKNIENRVVKNFVGGDLPGSPNLQWAELDAPRTYGVSVGMKF